MPSGGRTAILEQPEDICEYYDHPEIYYEKRDRMIERVERRLARIAQLDVTPDSLSRGGSGSLVCQSPRVFHELARPVLRRASSLARDLGIPTHARSCGPEKELVRMAAEETHLTVIGPLEVPPMGECDLAGPKRLYGDRIVLKGNLHTTDVMLRRPDDDVAASRKAIDDAARGGRFILSAGDQCGRHTPDENIRAMVETARTYARY